jgi:colanic acid/amylovoran biosynthesis protein
VWLDEFSVRIKTMKFVLSGVTGLRNRGVEALVRPVVDHLQAQFSPAHVTVLTRSPDYDSLRLCRPGVEFVKDGLTGAGLGSVRRLRERASGLWTRLAPDFQAARACVREADVLIASGGDVFTSDYGGPYAHLAPLHAALEADVPVVFLAHSIGPFGTKAEVEAWMRVASRAALITVRGSLSFRYLTRDLRLSESRVHETADVAFLLGPSLPGNASSWRQVYRLDDRAPMIAVSPSQGIVTYAGVDWERHIDAWMRVITMLVETLGAEVIIVPHVQETNATNDDRLIATVLARRLKDIRHVTLAGWDHSAGEFKGIISECDLVISERMHACIAGLSSGVPTVAVAYSAKAEGIMQSVLGDGKEELGVLIPVEQFLDPARASATVGTAWRKRAEIKRILLDQQERLRDQALANFSLLRRALGECGVCVPPNVAEARGRDTVISSSARS